MNTFETIFPTFLEKCSELHNLLESVAFAFFITGIIITVHHHFSHRVALHLTFRLMVLTSLLVYLPTWGNALQALLQNSVLSGLGVDPKQTYSEFVQLLIIKRDPTTTNSWWTVMSNLHNFSTDLMVTAFLWLIGHLASVIIFFAYIFQTVVLNLGYALSPLLIGFLAIPALRPTGNRYLMNLVGIIIWPLGWAVAALVTQGMLDFLTDPSFDFLDAGLATPGLQKSLGTAAIGIWMIFTTFAAPVMIQRVVSSGALAAQGLFSGAASTAMQTARSTISGGMAAAPLGPVGMVAGAASSGTLTLFSSSAGAGNAGSLVAPIAAFAAGKDDRSGDRAVQSLFERFRQGNSDLPPIKPKS